MIFPLSATCLRLSPTCRKISHVSPTCHPLVSHPLLYLWYVVHRKWEGLLFLLLPLLPLSVSYNLPSYRSRKYRSCNVNHIQDIQHHSHWIYSISLTLISLTQPMPPISNISSHTQTFHSIHSTHLTHFLPHTYYFSQCSSCSPIIQSNRPVTPCLAHLLIHSLTRNLVKFHMLDFWPLNCFQCRFQ